MTDLERARAAYERMNARCDDGMEPHDAIIAEVADALAAARREGAEEMRERAAAATTFCCFECSRVIRALPLTPEERE